MRWHKTGSILSDLARGCAYALCLAGLFAFVSQRYLCTPAEAVFICMGGHDLQGNVDILLIGIQLFLVLIPVYYLFQPSLRLSAAFVYVYACAEGSRRRIWLVRFRQALLTIAAVTAAVVVPAVLVCGLPALRPGLWMFAVYLLRLLILDQLLLLTTLLDLPAKYVWIVLVVWVCVQELAAGHGVLLPASGAPGAVWGSLGIMAGLFPALAAIGVHRMERFEFYADTVSSNSKRGNGSC